MPNQITTLAQQQRQEISQADAANLEAISRAYALMYDNLEGDIDALIAAIEALDEPTAAEIKRLPEYKRLMRRAESELDRFTVYLETVIGTSALAAIGLGLAHSEALVNAAIGGGFQGLESGAVRALLDFLRTDGPLYNRLAELTGATIERVVASIVEGVSSGLNPRVIASNIQDAFGGGLTDALRNTRTVQIKSYQESARANYISSDGIVTGWVWFTNLDGNPCMSCVSMHGTEHGLDETLDDHYNGECAPLPLIPEFGNPVEQSGQEWFDSLPEAQQRELMGESKLQAYQDGKFEFSRLSTQHENDVYVTMRSETPLKDLIEE
jgi:hypothetical protein